MKDYKMSILIKYNSVGKIFNKNVFYIYMFVYLSIFLTPHVAFSKENEIIDRFSELVFDGPSFNMGNNKLLKWNRAIRICFIGEKREETIKIVKNFFFKLRDSIDSVIDIIGGEECGIYIFEMNSNDISRLIEDRTDLWIKNKEISEKMKFVLKDYVDRRGVFYMHIWPDENGEIRQSAIIIDPSVPYSEYVMYLSCGIYNSLGMSGVFNMFLKKGCDADIVNTKILDMKIIRILYGRNINAGDSLSKIMSVVNRYH